MISGEVLILTMIPVDSSSKPLFAIYPISQELKQEMHPPE